MLNPSNTEEEAGHFVAALDYPSTVSLAVFAGSNHRVIAGNRKTNPGVLVVGSDENYTMLNSMPARYGRNLVRRK